MRAARKRPYLIPVSGKYVQEIRNSLLYEFHFDNSYDHLRMIFNGGDVYAQCIELRPVIVWFFQQSIVGAYVIRRRSEGLAIDGRQVKCFVT